MNHKPAGQKQFPKATPGKQPFRERRTFDQEQKEKHTSHRTQRVKVRGLMLDPPSGDGPVEVCVNYQADWELIYKNPNIQVKCLLESCETLLTAKRMSKSGLRFLAVRSGGCSHNLVEMRVDHGEVEQDPSNLVGGGGPEGDEHLWIKGRLLKIVQSLGVAAVLEHPLTRADVFLPDNNIALEYQRWDTNFQHRTAQRTSAGVETTIWLLPWQPTKAPRTKEHKSFNTQVFNHGGIYIAVLNKDNRYEVQRPWEDSSQERTARLYASGSIAVFDPSLGALVRKPRSLATVLSEIITGDRILANTFVLQKSDWRVVPALVWVLRDDLARVKSLLTEHRRDATPTTGKTSISVPNTERVTVPRHQPDSGSSAEAKTEEEQSPQLSVDVSTVENPNSMAGVALDSHSTTAHATFTPETRPTPHEVAPLASPHPITSRSKNPPRTPRRSMWKAITGWLGRM